MLTRFRLLECQTVHARITTSSVRKMEGASPIITPVTGFPIALTTRMRPWTGAVSNNKNNKGISTAPIYHTRWENRVSVCIGYGGYRTSCTASTPCSIHPGVQIGFPRAHRMYVCVCVCVCVTIYKFHRVTLIFSGNT